MRTVPIIFKIRWNQKGLKRIGVTGKGDGESQGKNNPVLGNSLIRFNR
jgi:hypothetical protein